MTKATTKPNVPDIKNLLGHLSKKRDSGELPKTELQFVQSVPAVITEKQENVNTEMSKSVNTQLQGEVKTEKSIASNTEIRKSVKTDKQPELKNVGGRPKRLQPGVEYVKMSPRIPESLKTELDIALARKLFTDEEGRPITTVDKIVELALIRLLPKNPQQ